MTKQNIKLSDLPEEITEEGLKIYGAASYETQVAILSHYLHSLDGKHDIASGEKRYEILGAIQDYFEYKRKHDKNNPIWEDAIQNLDDNGVFMVAESNPYENDLFADFFKVPFPAPENPKFTFIDLFAGVGGFHLALKKHGAKCLFSSEIDENARKTYALNHQHTPKGDITLPEIQNQIPPHNILCAGFPCQPFSVAGYRKGFLDTRGTLFFEIEKIVGKHLPEVVFLENVKNLKTHDKGNTFATIQHSLEQLGYAVFAEVLNTATHANIPQNRERIFIVCFHKEKVPNWKDFQLTNVLIH